MKIFTIDYTVDNAFGPRKHQVWRLYKKNLNHFNINLVPRKISIKDYKERRCNKVDYFPLCYFKNLHKTNPIYVKQNIDVSFVGTPYNDRADIIENLYTNYNIKTNINGNLEQWRNKISKNIFKKLKIKNDIYNQSYVKKIKKSKINLSFTSYDNLDEYPYRLLEIIMSGGFCLHQLKKNENLEILKKEKELITFKKVDELSNKIKYYLKNKKERKRIIRLGQKKIRKLNLDAESRILNLFRNYKNMILKFKS